MKDKVLVSLFLCACLYGTVSGATITVYPSDIAPEGWLVLGYRVGSGDPPPAAFGLTVSLSNGATFANPLNGEWSCDPGFNFFPEYAYLNPLGYDIGSGHPFASSAWPGSRATICMSAYAPYASDGRPLPGDINRDMLVDLADVMLLSSEWLHTGPRLWADLSGDGVVNLADAAILNGGEAPTPVETNSVIAMRINFGPAGFTDVTLGLPSLQGGIYAADGTAFDVILPGTFRVPEAGSMVILAAGSVMLRARARRSQ